MKKLGLYDISTMDVRNLAAHCLIARLSTYSFFSDKKYRNSMRKLAEEGIGGFCIFDGKPDDVAEMIKRLRDAAPYPILFCADFENGLPMRLEGGTEFPHAMALGKSKNARNSYRAAKTIASEAKAVGVDWILAPVCDVNSNSKNPIINIRAFGETPDEVKEHIEWYIAGLHSERILSCAKHFPGHGAVDIDSHLEVPVLNKSAEEIEETELKPFKRAVIDGVRSVMVGHLSVPAFEDSGTPASLSKPIVTDLLRKKLDFDGLVITDALDMKSITDKYDGKDSAVKAIEAGVDIVLLPPSPFRAIEAISEAAESNPKIKEKLQRSAAKLRDAKEWRGLFEKKFKSPSKAEIPRAKNEKIALSTAYDALEFSGEESIIPIEEEKRVGGFAFLQSEEIRIPTMFFRILSQAIENECDYGFIDKDIKDKDLFALGHGVQNADIMIFAFFFRPKAYSAFEVPDSILKAYEDLSKGKKTIAILFGNPYLKEKIKADLIISPFSDSLPSVAATILALSGREVNLK